MQIFNDIFEFLKKDYIIYFQNYALKFGTSAWYQNKDAKLELYEYDAGVLGGVGGHKKLWIHSNQDLVVSKSNIKIPSIRLTLTRWSSSPSSFTTYRSPTS